MEQRRGRRFEERFRGRLFQPDMFFDLQQQCLERNLLARARRNQHGAEKKRRGADTATAFWSSTAGAGGSSKRVAAPNARHATATPKAAKQAPISNISMGSVLSAG